MSKSIFVCLKSFSILMLCVCAAVLMHGQGYFGTVSGLVTDATGAVIPGAKVQLVDQEKGYKFETVTDGSGRYIFRSVAPGTYTVVAEMNGFGKTQRTNVRLSVSENPSANLVMKVAGLTQTVEVNADAQHLDAEDATTGLVVNRKFINDLPLVNRYLMDLTALTPGVTEADDQCGTGCTGTNFVSNGSRNSTSDVLMDGVTVTNMEPNGGVTQMTYTPSSEAVEEFRVEQSNFSAEYGFTGGSVVNMVTRSGTNKFHGEVYDFERNQLTDANSWFNNFYGSPLPSVHRHNFGGTLGGPIFKNKTFFFFDYDATRQTSAGTYAAGVPTDVERNNGDFGNVCTFYGGTFDSSGLCSAPQGQIWDPYSGTYGESVGPDGQTYSGVTRAAFIPYNNIGAYESPGNPNLNGTPYQLSGGAGNLIDPVAQNLMKLFPHENPSLSGNIYDNWAASGAGSYPNDQYDIKIDHRFSDKNLLSAKYSRQWSTAISYNCFGNFADPCAGGPNKGGSHLFAINDVHTFSTKMVLTTTVGFTRGMENINAYNGAGGVTDPLAKLGFPEYLNANNFMGVPAVFISGGYYSAGFTDIGGDPYGNYRQGQDAGQLTVAIDRTIGAHEIKVGFEGRVHQMNYIQTNSPDGTFSFDLSGTSGCPYPTEFCGGDAMASFMMGQMNSGTSIEIQDRPATEDRQFAWFVQENWKVNRKLTLNLGVRYDFGVPRTDRHNRQNWFDPTAQWPVNIPGYGAITGGDVFASSSERHMVNTDYRDIQPRFGFAYQLDPKTVMRGGYGIYYSQSRAGASGVTPYGSEGYNMSTGIIPTYQNDLSTPYLHMSNPYPNGLNQPSGNSFGVTTDFGYQTTGPLRTMNHTPYEQSWTFGFEEQVPFNVKLSMIYVGKKGTHLYFSGANWINHLGPWIESASPDQIQNELTSVNNPFANFVNDPNNGLKTEQNAQLQNSVLAQPQILQLNLDLPYPQFPDGVSTEAWPIANSTYHGLQLMAEKNYSNGMQLLATFVWSKSIDDSSVPDDNTTWLGSFTSMQDPNRPQMERSLSTFDIPMVFQLSYSYDLPFGRGKKFGGSIPKWVDAVAGGWKTNGVWRVNGGRPLTFNTYDGTPLPTYGNPRPNFAGTPRKDNNKHNWLPGGTGYIANPNSLVLPNPYTLGNVPRATGLVRTPMAFNTNMSMQKEFVLSKWREGVKLEMRLEAQNALNHPNFGTPNTSVDDPNFGTIGYTSNGPRQVQLGAKVNF